MKSNIVENQDAAANALKKAGADVGVETVRMARKLNLDGCLPGGRYDVKKLKKSIAQNAEALKVRGENISLKDQKTNEEIRKLKIANDAKEKLVRPTEWIVERDGRLAAKFKALLYSKLVDEIPADLTNDVATNRAMLRNVADRLLAEVVSWKNESKIT